VPAQGMGVIKKILYTMDLSKNSPHAFLGSVAKSVSRRITRPAFIIPLPKGEHDLAMHDI